MPIIHHDYLIPIEEDAILWRYMDLYKYESLLKKRALFFCRNDKYPDRFEGSLPKTEVESRYRQLEKIFSKNHSEESAREKANKIDNNIKNDRIVLRRATLVNSWSININESNAMWKLYLEKEKGVAIQSNSSCIQHALKDSKYEIFLSKVTYIDYDNAGWQYPIVSDNDLNPYLHKRIEFKDENEFRMFIKIQKARYDNEYWDKQPEPNGKFIPVDVNKLIEKIILPPTANEEVKNEVKKINSSYGFNFNIERSRLSSEPYY